MKRRNCQNSRHKFFNVLFMSFEWWQRQSRVSLSTNKDIMLHNEVKKSCHIRDGKKSSEKQQKNTTNLFTVSCSVVKVFNFFWLFGVVLRARADERCIFGCDVICILNAFLVNQNISREVDLHSIFDNTSRTHVAWWWQAPFWESQNTFCSFILQTRRSNNQNMLIHHEESTQKLQTFTQKVSRTTNDYFPISNPCNRENCSFGLRPTNPLFLIISLRPVRISKGS